MKLKKEFNELEFAGAFVFGAGVGMLAKGFLAEGCVFMLIGLVLAIVGIVKGE